MDTKLKIGTVIIVVAIVSVMGYLLITANLVYQGPSMQISYTTETTFVPFTTGLGLTVSFDARITNYNPFEDTKTLYISIKAITNDGGVFDHDYKTVGVVGASKTRTYSSSVFVGSLSGIKSLEFVLINQNGKLLDSYTTYNLWN